MTSRRPVSTKGAESAQKALCGEGWRGGRSKETDETRFKYPNLWLYFLWWKINGVKCAQKNKPAFTTEVLSSSEECSSVKGGVFWRGDGGLGGAAASFTSSDGRGGRTLKGLMIVSTVHSRQVGQSNRTFLVNFSIKYSYFAMKIYMWNIQAILQIIYFIIIH